MLRTQAQERMRMQEQQLLPAQPIGRAQQAHAQQNPVGRVDHLQALQYAPYNILDFAAFAPAPAFEAPRPAPAAPVALAAPVAPAAPVDPAALAARVASAAPTGSVAPAAPAAPAQPYVGDGLEALRYNDLVAGRRDAGFGQAVIQPGGIVRKCNLFADPHNNLLANQLINDPFADPYVNPFIDAHANNPFAQQFAIQVGPPWGPGAAIQAQGPAAQLGHRPNQQQGGGAHNETGARGSQFPGGFAVENAGFGISDIDNIPMPDVLGFPNPRRRGFAMPEIRNPAFPSTPAGEGRL